MISGGALMAGQMRMSLNTLPVKAHTIHSTIDNSVILCYATHVIVIHTLWISACLVSYIRLVLCLI